MSRHFPPSPPENFGKKHQNIREKRPKQGATRDKRPIKTNLKVKPGKNHTKHLFSTQTTQLTRKNPNLKQFFFHDFQCPGAIPRENIRH